MDTISQKIIIAPGTLHLPLYQEILNQSGGNLNIDVMTLNTWLSKNTPSPKPLNLEILYEFSNELENISPSNAYYESRHDYDFLKTLYDFLEETKRDGIIQFPNSSQKEKDLKEILDQLTSTPLWIEENLRINFSSMENIGILHTGWSTKQGWWIQKLLQQGATLLSDHNDNKQERYFWTSSNIRKSMELIANTIIEEEMDANDIFIALADVNMQPVLDQIFKTRNIPATFLHQPISTTILHQFQTALNYIICKNQENLENVLRTFYPGSSEDLIQYKQLFPEGSQLKDLSYEANPIISPESFDQLRSLELQMESWNETIKNIQSWNYRSVEKVAQLIQDLNPSPNAHDIKMFENIMNTWRTIKHRIHSNQDMNLFVKEVHQMGLGQTLEVMDGVLVGKVEEISPLRKTVFFVGPNAKNFPENILRKGIFDEAYWRNLPGKSLEERIEERKKNIFTLLSLPHKLYVVSAQSDYEGKSIEVSNDLVEWFGAFPVFRPVMDYSILTYPDFRLSKETSTALFAPQGFLALPLKALDSHKSCPLKYTLHYKAKLKAPKNKNEYLTVSPDILTLVLNQSQAMYGQYFWDLNKEQLASLLENFFSFSKKVFPHFEKEFYILQKEYECKISTLCELIQVGNLQVDGKFVPENFTIDFTEQGETFPITVTGNLVPFKSNSIPLSLLKNHGDDQTPWGHLYGSIQASTKITPQSEIAFKLGYTGKKEKPVTVNTLTKQNLEHQFIKDYFKKAFVANDLPKESGNLFKSISSKGVSYDKLNESYIEEALKMEKDIQEGHCEPIHAKDACKYCPYTSICRNGSKEKGTEK